jgi:hypothetical protein
MCADPPPDLDSLQAFCREINDPLEAITNALYLAEQPSLTPEDSRRVVRMASASLKLILDLVLANCSDPSEPNEEATPSL